MAKLTPFPDAQVLDDNGDPLAGGKIYTYEAGDVNTTKETYTDKDEGTPLPNPIILGDDGRPEVGGNPVSIWLGDGAYYIRVFDADDNFIDERDDVTGAEASGESFDISTNTLITSIYNNGRVYATSSPTLTLLSVDDAGDGFGFWVYNDGSGTVTIDPDGSETINNETTLDLAPNEWAFVVCDGDEWYAYANDVTSGGDNTFTGDVTFSGDVVLPAGVVDKDDIEDLSDYTVLGNVSGGAAAPAEVSILDEDDMSSDSDTALATQQSIKKYVDDSLALPLGTPQNATSGTSIDFTSIPTGTKRITVNFVGVSTNGSSDTLIQLGDSGGFEATGYFSVSSIVQGSGSATGSYTTGLGIRYSAADQLVHGSVIITLVDESTNTWAAQGVLGVDAGADFSCFVSGSKSLSDVLTQIRITTVGGTNTFDAGKINIVYE